MLGCSEAACFARQDLTDAPASVVRDFGQRPLGEGVRRAPHTRTLFCLCFSSLPPCPAPPTYSSLSLTLALALSLSLSLSPFGPFPLPPPYLALPLASPSLSRQAPLPMYRGPLGPSSRHSAFSTQHALDETNMSEECETGTQDGLTFDKTLPRPACKKGDRVPVLALLLRGWV